MGQPGLVGHSPAHNRRLELENLQDLLQLFSDPVGGNMTSYIGFMLHKGRCVVGFCEKRPIAVTWPGGWYETTPKQLPQDTSEPINTVSSASAETLSEKMLETLHTSCEGEEQKCVSSSPVGAKDSAAGGAPGTEQRSECSNEGRQLWMWTH